MTAREVKMEPNLNDPKAISDAGERIYDERYRQDYERDYPGQFVAVDVLSGNATLGGTSSEALLKARQQYPKGVFHLIRVGHAGAFEVGTAYRHVHTDRLPGRQRPS
jgi:hypothetical protein